MGVCQVTLMQDSAIEGMGAVVSYGLSPSSGQVTWEYTASSGNFVSIYARTRGMQSSPTSSSSARLLQVVAVGKGTDSMSPARGIQPGQTGPDYGVAGLTLDHVTFQGFYGDGILP